MKLLAALKLVSPRERRTWWLTFISNLGIRFILTRLVKSQNFLDNLKLKHLVRYGAICNECLLPVCAGGSKRGRKIKSFFGEVPA